VIYKGCLKGDKKNEHLSGSFYFYVKSWFLLTSIYILRKVWFFFPSKIVLLHCNLLQDIAYVKYSLLIAKGGNYV